MTKAIRSLVSKSALEQLVSEALQQGIQKLVVGAVIKRNGKYLLIERVPADFMGGLVELPSGTVDPGEDLLTALVREVKEETGLDAKSVLFLTESFDYLSGSGKKTRQFNFVIEVGAGDVVLNPAEHRAYYFVSPMDNEFAKLNTSEAVRRVIGAVERRGD